MRNFELTKTKKIVGDIFSGVGYSFECVALVWMV